MEKIGNVNEELELEMSKEHGVVTTTLLLATTTSNVSSSYGSTRSLSAAINTFNESDEGARIEKCATTEDNRSPLSNSSSSSLSSLAAMRIRMPCKTRMKKLKRHSLPNTSPLSTLILSKGCTMAESDLGEKRRSSLLQGILKLKEWSPIPALHNTRRSKTPTEDERMQPNMASESGFVEKETRNNKTQQTADNAPQGSSVPFVTLRLEEKLLGARLIYDPKEETEV